MTWTFYPASEFEKHAGSWDVLNACGFNSPLLSSHFALSALQALGSGREKLAMLGRFDHPDAMCILVQRGHFVWDTFQPSQAPLGFWLMRPGLEPEAVLTGLIHALPGFALVAGLTQQDPLLLPRPPDAGRLLTFDYITVAYLLLNERYESFWHARKNLRKAMRLEYNRLEKQGLAYQVKCVTDPDEVIDAVRIFARLEASGWKARQGTAVRFERAQGKFYVNLLQSFCRSGTGCIYYLTLNEVVAAMYLSVHQGDTVILLKTGYDNAYREYSPGMLLFQEILRILMDSEHFHRIEFYGRSTAWEMQLTDKTRTLYHVNVYRWAWLRRLAGWRIGISARWSADA